MPITRLYAVVIMVCCAALISIAQEVKTPILTETQALNLKASLQRVEIAQLKLQLLIAEYQKAQAEAQALVKTLQVEGYDLDLEKLVYTPKPKGVTTP